MSKIKEQTTDLETIGIYEDLLPSVEYYDVEDFDWSEEQKNKVG